MNTNTDLPAYSSDAQFAIIEYAMNNGEFLREFLDSYPEMLSDYSMMELARFVVDSILENEMLDAFSDLSDEEHASILSDSSFIQVISFLLARFILI